MNSLSAQAFFVAVIFSMAGLLISNLSPMTGATLIGAGIGFLFVSADLSFKET